MPAERAPAPFTVGLPQQALDDLGARLAGTRWPERETVDDWSQGVPLAYLRELVDYWREDHDWRSTEARLNRIPQFVVPVDGIDVHFLHVRSPRPDAVPLLLTHGWPGSFLEFEQTLGALSDPAQHGAPDAAAFHVVVPSLPGYGFSSRPGGPGWGVHRIAKAWATLMELLGYHRYLAGGSDWGTSVSTSLALQHPDRLAGLLLVPPLVAPDPATLDRPSGQERRALEELADRERSGSAYSAVHRTRPQTIGYSLLDSPVGLCAWVVEKVWSWADHRGDLTEVLSHDQLLDNVTLYWLTGTGASSARLYWESIAQVTEWFTSPGTDVVDVPTGCVVFPREVPRPSRRWAERRFVDIVHWSEPARGGHFGAWEQPEIFVAEVRALARALD